MKYFLLLILLFSTIFAQTSVWKVQKNNETIYLGGTIHLLRNSDYPLPKEFMEAFKASDALYLEVDMNGVSQKAIQHRLFNRMTLRRGERLSTLLSKPTYEKLKKIAGQYNIDIKQFETFKPAMLILTLSFAELNRLGLTAPGVDKYFENQSVLEKKPFHGLETISEQLKYASSIGEGHEESFVNQALKDLHKTNQLFGKIMAAWRVGDEEALNALLISDMKENFPNLYASILLERNLNWMPKIEALFNQEGVELVLVGTAHLVGEEGLLNLLKKKGYTITKF